MLPVLSALSRVKGVATAEPVIRNFLHGMANQPALAIELEPDGVGWCVTARNLSRDLVASLGGRAGSLLRVTIAESGHPDDELPDISGDYNILSDGVRFIPHFTFDSGVLFRAILDLGALGWPGLTEVWTREFSFSRETGAVETKVRQVFPSADVVPENLLRFYVRFSNPMQRGRAPDNIEILGPDGRSAPDILYRAPVELWDSSMTCLTVLLDPGRLKRGVGPNRALGPPLQAGEQYTLEIGRGMIDLYGHRLHESFSKSFGVSAAIREPIAIAAWKIAPPTLGSNEPLALRLPSPLDWAQLWHGISVASGGQPVAGRIGIDSGETRWRFTPDDPWQADTYSVRVAPDLEDICGNTPYGPFDRPVRPAHEVDRETAACLIPFVVKST
jgi:hypothetical protein